MPKCDFNKFNKAPLLKSLFGMCVLLNICCIFLEHLFPKTLLKGCFCNAVSSLYKKLYHICLARSQIHLQIRVNSPCWIVKDEKWKQMHDLNTEIFLQILVFWVWNNLNLSANLFIFNKVIFQRKPYLCMELWVFFSNLLPRFRTLIQSWFTNIHQSWFTNIQSWFTNIVTFIWYFCSLTLAFGSFGRTSFEISSKMLSVIASNALVVLNLYKRTFSIDKFVFILNLSADILLAPTVIENFLFLEVSFMTKILVL